MCLLDEMGHKCKNKQNLWGKRNNENYKKEDTIRQHNKKFWEVLFTTENFEKSEYQTKGGYHDSPWLPHNYLEQHKIIKA